MRRGCRGSGNLERLTVEGIDLGMDRDEGGVVEPRRDPVVIHFKNDTNRHASAWSSSRHAAHCGEVGGTMQILFERYWRQSTATSNAAQTSRIRASERRPNRSTSTPIATLSTESRLIADVLGMGSSPGSRSTSLGNPRTVVVHGATIDLPRRGMAASRESTTTGRRPMSASSHHQSSPRAGRGLTKLQQLLERTPDPPTRRLL